jgi:hypothetical protein
VRFTVRSKIVAALVFATMSMAMVGAPAFAAHQGSDHQGPPEPFAHPFCGSGAEYAEGHIVPLAQGQQIMAPEGGGVHNPGLAHEGFAVCDPSGS